MIRAVLKSFALIALLTSGVLPLQADDDAKFAVLSKIFTTVVDDDGHLTQDMHERYWKNLAGVLDEGAPGYEGFWSLIDKKVTVVTHRYVRAASEECMQALLKKDTELSSEYKNARASFLALAESGEDAEELKKAVESWDANVQKLGRKKYRPSNETKSGVIEALDVSASTAQAALHRYATLRQPQWQPAVTKRKYRSMPVAINWPGEFALTVQVERKLKARMLYHSMSTIDQVKVVHYRMGKRSSKFYKTALRQMAAGALNEYNAAGAKPQKEKWRGLMSYTVSGNGDADGVPANVIVRFLPSPDGNGVLGLYAISLGDGGDASSNFAKLQDAVLFE